MFRYLPFKKSMHSDELKDYITFGIKAFSLSGCEIMSVSDVSINEAFVIDLCRKCIDAQLDPIHLLDVIEVHI